MDEARDERNNEDKMMTGISTNFISSLNTRQAHFLHSNIFLKTTIADGDSQHSRMESRVGRVTSFITVCNSQGAF